MLHSEIHGRHLPGNGEGITLQDLFDLLRRIPRKARENYLTADGKDVLGISFGQSDQAEKWEFRASLVLDESTMASNDKMEVGSIFSVHQRNLP